MNVDEYLARIGYTGPREPTIQTLKELVCHHKMAIPFSNLYKFGGEKLCLDLQKIYKKIVSNKQGGVCLELNALFFSLLQHLGFNSHLVKSYYIIKGDDGEFRYKHPAPVVDFPTGGAYLADVGVYSFGILKVEVMKPQVSPFDICRFRSVPEESDWLFLERHKKTILNAKDEVLKEGPAPPGMLNGMCNDECAMQESSHWRGVLKICMKPVDLEVFADICEDSIQLDMRRPINRLMALFIYGTKTFTCMEEGDVVCVKESLDPITDKILINKKITSDGEIPSMARDFFGYEINHDVKYFNQI